MEKLVVIILILLTATGLSWWLFVFEEKEPQELIVSDSVSAIIGESDSDAIQVQEDEITKQGQVEQSNVQPPSTENQDSAHVDEVGKKQVAPAEVFIDVPFIVQAPFANWDVPYDEACEEASIMMVHAFYQNQTITTQEQMKTAVDSIIFWGQENLSHFDTTSEESSRYLTDKLGYSEDEVHVIYDMTIDDMKAVLAKGIPIIVPAAGRELGNIYFQNPGPIYHMLVIVGYDGDEFITNDPGTRRGEGYRYDQNILYSAIHDLTDDIEQISTGRKAMIVVQPNK